MQATELRERSTIGLLAGLLLGLPAGCRGPAHRASHWPTRPDLVLQRNETTYFGYDLDHDGRLDYLQRLHDGYKDRLYFPRTAGGAPNAVVVRPAADPRQQALLLVLLDGVAYDRMDRLWEAGHFRLFHHPACVVSTFPTLTDPAYDAFFGCGPTPGYEAGYFDRSQNRLTDGVATYLQNENERWVRYADYRINVLRDAFMYLFPRRTFAGELKRGWRALKRRFAAANRDAVIYFLSTDGLGHMCSSAEIDHELLKLDAWIERVVYQYRGEVEIVMLADHGMSAMRQQRFALKKTLRAAGLNLVSHLEKPGDVAVPLFGLLDVARIHTYDDATRDQVLAACAARPEIELVAWRDGDSVFLRTADGEARIQTHETGHSRIYRYEPIDGDPLSLADRLAASAEAAALDADGFASEAFWLRLTAGDDFPNAVPRLWDGMFTLSDERPNVVLSLANGWFVGSGFLASFVEMSGTHGGLHRRASLTFAMTTSGTIPGLTDLSDFYKWTCEHFEWERSERP